MHVHTVRLNDLRNGKKKRGTFRVIPEHQVIMIVMRKICRIKFSKTEKTNNLDGEC